MKTAVIIPFCSDDPHRLAAFLIVLAFYKTEFPEWEIIAGGDDTKPFSRAASINMAAEQTAADIIVINDADSLCESQRIAESVESALTRPGLVRAYTSYRRLSREASEVLTPATYLDAWQGPFDWEMENAHAHGCIAVQRECFNQVGGYDEKFRGWGYEDLAAEMLYDAFWPDRRTEGTLVHLWHPSISEGPDVDRNAELYYQRYSRLRGNAEALLALRNEP